MERPLSGIEHGPTQPMPWAEPAVTLHPGPASQRPRQKRNRKRRQALIAVAGTVAFVTAMLLAVNMVFGLPALPLVGERDTASQPPALVKFDSGLYFEKGTVLSDRSATPSLLVSARWTHPTGIVCSQSGAARDKGSNGLPVATFTESTTKLPFEAVAGRMYETTVHARTCEGSARDQASTADFVWHLHQETVATYSSGWNVGRCMCWSGKSIMASTAAGQTATFRGSFTSFGLITDHGKNRGTADIYLDGVKVGSIDGRSPVGRGPMPITFATRATANVEHTVLIKVTNGRVDVDAFVTSGTPTQRGAKQRDEPLEAP